MQRKRTSSSAWVRQIFESSKVANRGGPVRRNLSSIDKHSTRAIVIAEARKRRWIIDQIGFEWFFYDAALPRRRIVSSFPAMLVTSSITA
jgi:hypothetical protein